MDHDPNYPAIIAKNPNNVCSSLNNHHLPEEYFLVKAKGTHEPLITFEIKSPTTTVTWNTLCNILKDQSLVDVIGKKVFTHSYRLDQPNLEKIILLHLASYFWFYTPQKDPNQVHSFVSQNAAPISQELVRTLSAHSYYTFNKKRAIQQVGAPTAEDTTQKFLIVCDGIFKANESYEHRGARGLQNSEFNQNIVSLIETFLSSHPKATLILDVGMRHVAEGNFILDWDLMPENFNRVTFMNTGQNLNYIANETLRNTCAVEIRFLYMPSAQYIGDNVFFGSNFDDLDMQGLLYATHFGCNFFKHGFLGHSNLNLLESVQSIGRDFLYGTQGKFVWSMRFEKPYHASQVYKNLIYSATAQKKYVLETREHSFANECCKVFMGSVCITGAIIMAAHCFV